MFVSFSCITLKGTLAVPAVAGCAAALESVVGPEKLSDYTGEERARFTPPAEDPKAAVPAGFDPNKPPLAPNALVPVFVDCPKRPPPVPAGAALAVEPNAPPPPKAFPPPPPKAPKPVAGFGAPKAVEAVFDPNAPAIG